LKAQLKIHSSLQKFFSDSSYTVDLHTYFDVVPYLNSMHPKFKKYMLDVEQNEFTENVFILDSDYRIVEPDEAQLRRIKDDDTLYLVPGITGGGGKRGGLFAMVAMIGFAAATGGLGAFSLGGAGAAALPASATAVNTSTAAGVATASGGAGGGLFSAFSSLPGFAKNILGNIALAVVASLFTSKPKPMETDNSTRENGMFGSLTNTSESGTPIPLVYGHFRVAGQFLSGYIDSEQHGKNDVVNVGDKFS
jgi:predicted phage tail protein